ncbi:MAG: hypothetical protein KDC66_20820, partial [Phaeodactylibacter sp.]|nr:hypothetical protein [Phaeodactylibacter sp.]
ALPAKNLCALGETLAPLAGTSRISPAKSAKVTRSTSRERKTTFNTAFDEYQTLDGQTKAIEQHAFPIAFLLQED